MIVFRLYCFFKLKKTTNCKSRAPFFESADLKTLDQSWQKFYIFQDFKKRFPQYCTTRFLSDTRFATFRYADSVRISISLLQLPTRKCYQCTRIQRQRLHTV